MRRAALRFGASNKKAEYATAVPAVAEFWSTCVATPVVTGPNVALATVQKVSRSLQIADDSTSLTTDNFGGDAAHGADAQHRTVMTKKDAVLHASIASRLSPAALSSSSSSSSNTASNSSGKTSSASVSSSSHLLLPEFIYRRKTKEISQEADKIHTAYQEYYNHIKFRNGWEKPSIPKDDPLASEMLHESADICARIRARLDEENPSTKLRQADGAAQVFFNSPDAGKLFLAAKAESESNDKILADPSASAGAAGLSQFHRREFVKAVVLANFKDAMGFVEGLTKTKLEKYFADISDFGFNPSAHVQHLLLEMLSSAEIARLSFDVADAVKYDNKSYDVVSQEEAPAAGTGTAESSSSSSDAATPSAQPPSVSRRALDRARQSRDNAHFCEEDGAEDKLWRDAIGKLYKAHDALLLAVAERKKNASKQLPAIQLQQQQKQ